MSFLLFYTYRRSDVSNSEIGIPKPLPLKSGSCLDILKPLKPVTEDKKTKEDKPVEVCAMLTSVVWLSGCFLT